MATGKNVDYTVTMGGQVVPLPPRASLRWSAIQDLAAHGYGLPTQSIELSGLEDIHDDLTDKYDTPTTDHSQKPTTRKKPKQPQTSD